MNLRIAISLLMISVPFQVLTQGHFQFSNVATDPPGRAPVTISTAPGTFNPSNGTAGAYVGADYTASLFWLNGTVTSQDEFESMNPMLYAAADARFFGTTGIGPGHGPTGDASGFFEGGIVYLLAASSNRVTVQVRAWYNGNGDYTSYAEALAAGQNVGRSNPVGVIVTFPPQPAVPLFGVQPFTVGIPEPSTFVLAALGGAALLLFRRRK